MTFFKHTVQASLRQIHTAAVQSLIFPMVIKVCFLLSLPCQFVAKETGYEDNENYQLVPTSFSWCLIIFPPSSLASEILFIPLQWRKGFLDGKRKQPNIICVEVHHCQLQPNFTFNLQNLRLILVVNPFHSIELVCLFSSFRTVSEYNTLLPFSFFFFPRWTLVFKGSSTIRRRNLKTVFSIWKRIKYFTFTLRRRNLKSQQPLVQILNLCFEKNTRTGKSHDYRNDIVFEKLHFQSVFRPHENERPAFSNSSGLTSGFENEAPFSWRISVDGRPNRRNKVAFSNFSSVARTLPKRLYFYPRFLCHPKLVNMIGTFVNVFKLFLILTPSVGCSR